MYNFFFNASALVLIQCIYVSGLGLHIGVHGVHTAGTMNGFAAVTLMEYTLLHCYINTHCNINVHCYINIPCYM